MSCAIRLIGRKVYTAKHLQTRNAWQSPAVARQAPRTQAGDVTPCSDQIVASATCATLSATRAFHSVHTTGVLWVHSTFLSLVTFTFDFWPWHSVIQVKDQTRFPCEFGTNPFSSSCHSLWNVIPENWTHFDDFAHLAHKWLSNHHHKLRS